MSHAGAIIQFVLHSFKQSTASLTKDRVLKMKSVLLSIVFIALLLVSLGPDGSDCMDAGKRSEVNSNRQKAKNSLEIFWYPYDRTSKVLLVSLYIIMIKFYFFFRNHAFIYILFFQRKVISYRRSLCEAARKLDCYREMELKDD